MKVMTTVTKLILTCQVQLRSVDELGAVFRNNTFQYVLVEIANYWVTKCVDKILTRLCALTLATVK